MSDKKLEKPTRAKSPEDLAATITKLIADVSDDTVTMNGNADGYGKCVEAMWQGAFAAFDYISSELGVTGFQASCADLMFVSATRNIDGPMMLIQAEDHLYPQYDRVRDVQEWLGRDDTAKYLRERATALLAESSRAHVHPAVWAHWEKLAATA